MVPSSLFLTCGLDMSFTVLFSQSPGPLCEGEKNYLEFQVYQLVMKLEKL